MGDPDVEIAQAQQDAATGGAQREIERLRTLLDVHHVGYTMGPGATCPTCLEPMLLDEATQDRLRARYSAEAEKTRVMAIVSAIAQHGSTAWPDTTCGRGGVGGRAITYTHHGDAVQHLAVGAIQGHTLKQLADRWALMHPGSARLDQPPRAAHRAGPDGRPI
jgi:hypothetical protein